MKNLFINVFKVFCTTMIFFSTILFTQNLSAQRDRNDIDAKFKWDLTHLYPSDEAWKISLENQMPKVDELVSYRGKLATNAKTLFTFLEKQSDLYKEMSRLYSYASMKADEDTGNGFYQGMNQEISQKFSTAGSKMSFVSPELAAIPKETIDKFMKQQPKLKTYAQFFDNLYRQQKYILTDKEERIIAEAGKLKQAPYNIYNIFSNAEMPFPTITLSTGEKLYLDQAAYTKHRSNENAADRALVFKEFWKSFESFKSTFSQQLYANVNADVFTKNARGYNSCLESSISANNIPVEVYHSLIANINKNLPTFHRYLNIKKRLLGVDTLKYSDTYASGVKGVEMMFDYEKGKELVVNATKPLGESYSSVVARAFDEGWVDMYPSKGKRSGAYSNGSAYDVHPYVLMNYNDDFDGVTTLAHEFGHAMHSYLSNKNQAFANADYSIFVAEVASTVNERLLAKLILEETTDPNARLSLLMDILDGFRTTLFRQTQFAEFELKIHEAVENGKPLTADVLNEMYKDILYRYYGHNEGVCNIEDIYAVEWAYIPHFYYNFYVYQYATSFTASVALGQDILNGTPEAVSKYLKFLSSGSSKYPIDLLKETGVDMTSEAPFVKAMTAMNYYMDEVEKLLAK